MEVDRGNPVVYLGPEGSYSHQATAQQFPSPQHTLEACATIEAVFAAVQQGAAATGVVPFENSSNGTVAFTLDLLVDARAQYRDIIVCAEIYLPVRHCLVGHAIPHSTDSSSNINSTVPSTAFSHITKLYSHPQAWGQCRRFLSTNLPTALRQDTTSTSQAAATVAQEGPHSTSAAISSHLAAKLHNLQVLAEPLEDDVGRNCTRFLTIRRRPSAETDDVLTLVNAVDEYDMLSAERPSPSRKTLVAFAVGKPGKPGALAEALAVFKKHGLNLTSINTRPSAEAAWDYVFLVECVGARTTESSGVSEISVPSAESNLAHAMMDLAVVVRWRRWLGSWEDTKGQTC